VPPHPHIVLTHSFLFPTLVYWHSCFCPTPITYFREQCAGDIRPTSKISKAFIVFPGSSPTRSEFCPVCYLHQQLNSPSLHPPSPPVQHFLNIAPSLVAPSLPLKFCLLHYPFSFLPNSSPLPPFLSPLLTPLPFTSTLIPPPHLSSFLSPCPLYPLPIPPFASPPSPPFSPPRPPPYLAKFEESDTLIPSEDGLYLIGGCRDVSINALLQYLVLFKVGMLESFHLINPFHFRVSWPCFGMYVCILLPLHELSV
jgi:hypothetical protein